jgi:glycosyltransferase involved in cell wall biosynthesis
MKILLVCEAVFPENKGGIERWFQVIAQEFQSKGHEITYFNSSGLNETRDGLRYLASSSGKWSYKKGGVRSKAQAIRFGINLFKYLRKQRFDMIYCSSVPIFSIFAVFLGKKRDSKVFVEWFEIWNLRYWFRYSGFFAGAVAWLVQLLALQLGRNRVVYTERARRSIYKLGFLNRSEVVLLPGLCPELKPAVFGRQASIKHDIYFLGRFVKEKQPILAINYIEAFLKTGWMGMFWLAGTGPLAAEIREIIQVRKLERHVKILENPTDEEIDKIARNSFLLLHPSRREGYGLASVEAAYRGVPSLLIDYEDNSTVDLEISPRLVAPNDQVEEIVKLLTLAWENQKYFESETLTWSENARRFRSSSKTCSKILEIASEDK